MEKLAALNGTAARVEVHAAGDGSAPRAILSGAVGALSMDGETASGDPRGLVFVPIGADGSTDPGCRPGIYFDAHSFASAKGAEPLTLALHDETLFVISTQS